MEVKHVLIFVQAMAKLDAFLFPRKGSPVVERRARDRKVAGSIPGKRGGRILFSRVNFLCWLLSDFGDRPIPVLPQWHVKDLGHSAKSAGSRLHLKTHTPLIHRSRSGLTVPLSRQSVGICQETSLHATRLGTRSQSSQLAEPLRTDPGLKSGISLRELISTY